MMGSMQHTLILGAQWGDEGKGKIVDWLSQDIDFVCRFQGGHNAGHTLKVGDQTLVLHLIPSGVLHAQVHCLIGSGVVICSQALAEELAALKKMNIDTSRLTISLDAHVILPYHKILDQLRESVADNKIGTTGRGIGPAYEDKVARRGIRLADFVAGETHLRQKISQNLVLYNSWFKHNFSAPSLDVDVVMAESVQAFTQFSDLVGDVKAQLIAAHQQNKNILFEGAQGALLDVSHGTYPFVTSSHTTLGGAIIGSGAGFLCNQSRVIGIAKAYATRVGNGYFPTELHDSIGVHLAKQGHEFGSTTGRARRCGWLDLVALKSVVQENNMDQLCITKLDVLDGLPELCVCTSYKTLDGQNLDYLPEGLNWAQVTPQYRAFAGWQGSVAGITDWQELPQAAKTYVEFIAMFVGIKVSFISTGAQRDHTIVCN